MQRLVTLALSGAALAAVAGCGGSGKATAPSTTSPATTTSPAPPTTSTTATPSPGPLQAEANSAAAGDIPDNQVFLLFRNSSARVHDEVSGGLGAAGLRDTVTFRDKNNIARVVVERGPALSARTVRGDIAGAERRAACRARRTP